MPHSDLKHRLIAVALVVAPGGAAVYFAFAAGGTAAGAFATVALILAAVLVLRLEPESTDRQLAGRTTEAAVLALPGAIAVYLGFNSGGYFPDTTAFAVLVLVVILVLRTTLA